MVQSKFKPVPWPDIHHLNAAEGWIGLGNPREAEAEFAKIKPRFHRHPDVLAVRWPLLLPRPAMGGLSGRVLETALQVAPGRPAGWIHRSYTLHELKRTAEAFDQLLPAAARFPKVWTIPYNLSCYCAQLGRLEEAKAWFKKAAAIEPETVRRAGIQDQDSNT